MIDTNRPVRHMSYKGDGHRLADMINTYPHASITGEIHNGYNDICYYRIDPKTNKWVHYLGNDAPEYDPDHPWFMAYGIVEYRDGIIINMTPYEKFFEHTEAGHLNCYKIPNQETVKFYMGKWVNQIDENNN